MIVQPYTWSRRGLLKVVASNLGHVLGGMAAARLVTLGGAARADERAALAADRGKALVAITLDLEMSRNFPQWEATHWDYEKGNLNAETKAYTVQACRRVLRRGGVVHCFCVGRVLEQENVDWLIELAAAGHPVGNHTYDHVNVKAATPAEAQFRFQRAPWLVEGKTAAEVIRENIRMTNVALRKRCQIEVQGFRTPGGFDNGLEDRPDVQQWLLDLGFTWVSSKYPAHPLGEPGSPPSAEVYDAIVAAQRAAQPFTYESGLVEVPMSPISDISAFRGGRWKLEWFLEAVRRGVAWAIEHRAVFDLLAHPSCLYVVDPEFRTIDLVLDLVEASGGAAVVTDLNTLAARAAAT